MAENESNAKFLSIEEPPKGRIYITLCKDHFDDSDDIKYYGTVQRKIYSPENLMARVEKGLPGMSSGIILEVVNKFLDAISYAVGMGYAVKCGNLGLFYIAAKGLVSNDMEKPAELAIKFTPSKSFSKVLENVEVAASEVKQPHAVIRSIIDMQTGEDDGTLNAGSSVMIEGRGLRISGEGSGVFFAPVAENGAPVTDEAQWVRVETPLVVNMPSRLAFQLPPSLAKGGRYRIVLRTRCAYKSKFERKKIIQSITDIVTVT